MPTAQQLISVATGQLGYKEQPAGSNRTKYGEWYGMNGQPWCAIFISWCAAQIGATDLLGGKFAYTPSWANWFKSHGQWLDREEKPQPGDLVFFHNSSRICHVGIVTRRNGTVSVSTIEGNTSAGSNANGGQVQARTRGYGRVGSPWYIAGFGRPKWNGPHPGNTGTSRPLLDVDGEWGYQTTRASQAALGTPVDGYVDGQRKKYRANWPACLSSSWRWATRGSSEMVAALQRVIEADPDGIAGPATARAFQAWLGRPVNGKVSGEDVKVWQRRLNGGWSR